MRLVQYRSTSGHPSVARVDGEKLLPIRIDGGTRNLAMAALASGRGLEEEADRRGYGAAEDYTGVLQQRRVLPPLTHSDPAHCVVSGTGLTHLGSADTRHAMHNRVMNAEAETLSDSMKMFRLGVEGGKPQASDIGAQPEWFYKGDGSILSAPEQPLDVPSFSQDAGEEPELVGLYLIGADGLPYRLGFALGNELSDHVTERFNYLWLAHSKLRSCSVGPELLTGSPAGHLQGTSRITRDGDIIWEKSFVTGEGNMSHSIANLEHHHFKYRQFRHPGDVHLHFMGTATLSFADGVKAREGDCFEIAIPEFGRPLRNALHIVDADAAVRVAML